jgi:hypothetical protein
LNGWELPKPYLASLSPSNTEVLHMKSVLMRKCLRFYHVIITSSYAFP